MCQKTDAQIKQQKIDQRRGEGTGRKSKDRAVNTDGIPQRIEMGRIIFLQIDRPDRYFLKRDAARFQLQQHIRLIFITAAFYLYHNGKKPCGNCTQAGLGVRYFNTAHKAKHSFCQNISEPASERYFLC